MLFRIFTEPQQGATYGDQLAAAKVTEECGFDAFFRSDHFMVQGDRDGLPGPTDSWITLAGLARETSTIRLGTLVSSATFRNPGVLAVSVAQVDQMSGGRVELGLGTGWMEAEHTAYGLDFPDLGTRFDRLQEQLELITGLWDTPLGETYTFSGKHYTIEDSPALPKSVQQPHPPVIIGGGGKKKTPALAARYATEFNSGFQSAENTASQFERVRQACVAIGRDPQTLNYSIAMTTIIGRNDAEVRRRLEVMGGDTSGVEANAWVGSPAEIVDRIGTYAELAPDRIYLQIQDLTDLDQIELLASEVIPQLS